MRLHAVERQALVRLLGEVAVVGVLLDRVDDGGGELAGSCPASAIGGRIDCDAFIAHSATPTHGSCANVAARRRELAVVGVLRDPVQAMAALSRTRGVLRLGEREQLRR